MIKKAVIAIFAVFLLIIAGIAGLYIGTHLGPDMRVKVQIEYDYTALKNETIVIPREVYPGGIFTIEFEHLIVNARYIIGIPDCLGYNTILNFKPNKTWAFFWIVFSGFDSLWILRKENQDRDENIIATLFFELD